ncbi:hypothetical protein QT972_30605, partial [Microcoleus sp. herbarium7]
LINCLPKCFALAKLRCTRKMICHEVRSVYLKIKQIRTRQCRFPTRLFVGKRHCRLLNLGNINISTGTQKPGFFRNTSLQPTDSGKNPVSWIIARR